MTLDIKKSIPKIICGKETATAFLIKNDIALTAMHAIIDYFENKDSIKLIFKKDNERHAVSAKPILQPNETRDGSIVALKLDKKVEDIDTLECIDFNFKSSLNCRTFGYPPARNNDGTFIDLQVKDQTNAENYKLLDKSWNIDLRKNDDIKDFQGVSGAPVIIDNSVVAVLLNQVEEDGETSRLSAISLNMYKDYFKYIQVNLVEKKSDGIYKTYLETLRHNLNSQLENKLPRKLIQNSDNPLGFAFNFTKNKDKEIKIKSYYELLKLNESSIILSEPGGGKSYLLAMLARDIIDNPLHQDNKVPIILKAKNWKRSFVNIIDGVMNELKYSLPDITKEQIKKDFYKGKFLILVDGLDETQNSLDLLNEELINVSRIKDLQIIITSRYGNYYKQLISDFVEYDLEQLNDEMVIEYIGKVLNKPGWQVIRNIDGSLKTLIKNPLFLFMTVTVLEITGGINLPKNKSELYENYVHFLLDGRNSQKGIESAFKIDSSIKEKILSEYAKRTFRRVPNKSDFVESIALFLDTSQVEVVKKELLETGILILEKGNPAFFHPSFHEYFFAINIFESNNEEFVNFLAKYSDNESYFEVFTYLVGLLKNYERQKLFLDYLEKHNLYLFRKCLEARFVFNNEKKNFDLNVEMIDYFTQVRDSYLHIIESHFNQLKNYFSPWSFVQEKQNINMCRLAIKGSVNYNKSIIAIQFFLLPKDNFNISDVIIEEDFEGPQIIKLDKKGNEVSIPVSISGTNYWSIDLFAQNMGLDSAREVALYIVRKQLLEILDKKELIEIEPPQMAVLQIEATLRKLPKNQFNIFENHQRKPLSLYKYSINQIIDALLKGRVEEYYKYQKLFSETYSIEILYMINLLFRLKDEKIDSQQYLLPHSDIDWKTLKKPRGFVWELWSDNQLNKRIACFYEYYQSSYRYMVSKYFPSLKKNMPLYGIGPIKFNIKFYRDEEHGGVVITTWEPVTDMSNSIPNIEQLSKSDNEQDSDDDYTKSYDLLSKMGRERLPFFTKSNSAIDLYIDDKELRKRVYSQLKDDLIYILGD